MTAVYFLVTISLDSMIKGSVVKLTASLLLLGFAIHWA
jgi:hypothetical protein